MREFLFNLPQKRNGTTYLPDRCGMNPDRPFERGFLKKSHSLRQRLTKSLLDETPQQKVRSRKEEEECKKDVVY